VIADPFITKHTKHTKKKKPQRIRDTVACRTPPLRGGPLRINVGNATAQSHHVAFPPFIPSA